MFFLNFPFRYLIVNRWRLRHKLWRTGLRKMFVLIRTSLLQRRTFGHRFMQDCHSSLSKNELISFRFFGSAIKKFATEWQVPSFPPHLTSWSMLYQLNYEANEWQVPPSPAHLPSRWMLYQLNYDATEWQFPSFLSHPPTWWMLYQLNYEGTKWQAPWSPPHLPPWLMLSQLNYQATEWQVTSSLTHLPPWSIL